MSLLKHLTKGAAPQSGQMKKPFLKSHHNFFLSNRAALAKVLLSLIRAKATGSNCRANLSNCFCKPFATKPIPRGHVKDRELNWHFKDQGATICNKYFVLPGAAIFRYQYELLEA